MNAVTATAPMSSEEFLARPLALTARRSELIDGELVMNEPGWTHNRAQLALVRALDGWAHGVTGRGVVGLPLDVQLDDRNVYAPDVVWYRDGNAPGHGDPAPYPIPDIAVEVRSPSTWRHDIGVKKAGYERRGVGELWLADTAADVLLVFRRSRPKAPRFDVSLELDRDATLTSPLLPGFTVAVGEIFADG